MTRQRARRCADSPPEPLRIGSLFTLGRLVEEWPVISVTLRLAWVLRYARGWKGERAPAKYRIFRIASR